MTLLRHSSHVLRRVIVPPETPGWKGYWILLLPALMMAFQAIPLVLPALGVRPTLAIVLIEAMTADLLTVGVACLLVAGKPGNRREGLGLMLPRRKRDLILLPLLGGLLSLLAAALAESVYSWLTGEKPPAQVVVRALMQFDSPGLRLLAVAGIALVAPIAEEIVFRGVSFRGLRRRMRFLPAAALSAILFSLAHVDLAHGLQLFAIGLILAWTVERSGSILPGMLLHAGINLTSLLLIWNS